jgi:hypothetical protein
MHPPSLKVFDDQHQGTAKLSNQRPCGTPCQQLSTDDHKGRTDHPDCMTSNDIYAITISEIMMIPPNNIGHLVSRRQRPEAKPQRPIHSVPIHDAHRYRLNTPELPFILVLETFEQIQTAARAHPAPKDSHASESSITATF